MLLVDYDPVTQEVACELLARVGLNVEVAGDGAQAIEAVRRRSATPYYDLILMDLQMPRIDGLSATRTLRVMQHAASIPVLAMSESTDPQERHRCLQAGMNGWVAKPLQIGDLYPALLHWLSRSRG